MVRVMVVCEDLKAPALLVAVPRLNDPHFAHGVILIVDHGDHGSMGLLLNQPTNLNVGSFCDSQNMRWEGDRSPLVHHGGPVHMERAFILHSSTHQGPETQEIMTDVHLSYSLESLKLLAESPPSRYRVFLGYAGWGPGQLAKELTTGSWLMGQANTRLLFDVHADRLWQAVLHDMGIDPMMLIHSGKLH